MTSGGRPNPSKMLPSASNKIGLCPPPLQEFGSGACPLTSPATVRKSLTVFTSPFAGKLPTAKRPPALVIVRFAVGTADQLANIFCTRVTPCALLMTTGPPLGCRLRGPLSTRYAIGLVLSQSKGTPEMPCVGPPTASGPPENTTCAGESRKLSSTAALLVHNPADFLRRRPRCEIGRAPFLLGSPIQICSG